MSKEKWRKCMRTPETIKSEKISHLEYCLDKLLQKDNGYNEIEIKRLYSLIYRVICEMQRMEVSEALNYFSNNINEDVRIALKRLNIELNV